MSSMEDDLRKRLPALTRDQMAEVDRAMVEDLGIELLQTMENAGRHLAHLTRERFLGGDPRGKHVSVLAGAGADGGAGLVAARRLFNWGAAVQVILVRPRGDYRDAPARQLAILEKMRLPIASAEEGFVGEGPDVILDAMLGYDLGERPKHAVADGIRWANAQPGPVLALDIPSGLDAMTGEVKSPSIRAAATLALALPKTGLVAFGAEEFVGELYLADIGVPEIVYRRMGLDVGPLFAVTDLLRLS